MEIRKRVWILIIDDLKIVNKTLAMRTAMQELIKWANTPPPETGRISIMTKMEQLLEKEKKQILKARTSAPSDFGLGGGHGFDSNKEAENYYYESFKPSSTDD